MPLLGDVGPNRVCFFDKDSGEKLWECMMVAAIFVEDMQVTLEDGVVRKVKSCSMHTEVVNGKHRPAFKVTLET